jgi:16S rRNA (guanine1207-N2)-methyltransferase
MQQFNTPFQSLTLQRLPLKNRETLRAWDAADEYLLEHLGETGVTGRILIQPYESTFYD